ncbi:DUF305 domain-containing protein [Mycolicibacterium chitae]|uniref:Lipoprotein n=2 Tax=Mycolicibacterium TaxID=1866885 RepID=A0A448IAL9_MYCCI|nr:MULTISPECIES: DUF305 domain-containing protein [Mycolicibacterium]MCV7003099.1 DUF305 domain-containing protein [Mycolicibacterium alvei]MCV7107796.1 DUF305 domain-containing protein [Mycolicibacterium chitae]VEG49407.1 lipoprotein [Mycolicibacterium chitae]BBX26914.1 DUF305 domain-containing protein [Mycolicibacterium alvei]BBZ05797.1 DUF305 domain-containing protein [Mycolicibacterium chitae]
MNKKCLAVGATALAVVFAAAACSNSDTETTAASSPASPSVSTSVEEAAAHNDADVMFAQMMLPHHAQAIEMSDMILAKEDIPVEVTTLAGQIKAAQGPEIEQLESWLEQWGAPTSMPEGHHDMPGMDEESGMGGMKGMMSAEDMQALSQAQGTDAARLFLEQMIAHHEGAVEMAQTEVDDGQFPDAVALARSIIDTQQQEIETMRQLLSSL